MTLKPEHLTIKQLLTDRLFKIPKYQRAYAWKTKQRRDLFGDIKEAFHTDRDHFMATIVALDTGKKETIVTSEYKIVDVVDGQQRLTTLVILLKAIEKKLGESNNDETLQDQQKDIAKLLVKRNDYTLILLQTNHDSSHVFREYLCNGKINSNDVKSVADKNILDAATDCEKFVNDWQSKNGLIDLLSTIWNRLSLIYHELTDEAAVFRVFEVLNSRGLDVRWLDKLKSQLMGAVFEGQKGGTRDEAIDEMHKNWGKIYGALIDETSEGSEALRFLGTWLSEKPASKLLNESAATKAITDYAQKDVKKITATTRDLLDTVIKLVKLHSNPRQSAVTGIINARFVAVAILRCNLDNSHKDDLIEVWEKVTFRIYGLARKDSRTGVGEYVRLGQEIIRGNLDFETIKKRLLEILKPNNDDPYDFNVLPPEGWSDRYNGWTKELRYLLARYDEYLAKKAGQEINESEWEKIWVADVSKSIEHISPQKKGESYVHDIGNLTLLPPGINSTLQDQDPAIKASTYTSCGILGTRKVGESISKETKWTKDMVDRRRHAILEFVKTEWGGI